MSTDGDKNLGGFDFDNEIINYANQIIMERFQAENVNADPAEDDELQQDLRGKSEQAKKALTVKASTSIAVATHGKRIKIDITRDVSVKTTDVSFSHISSKIINFIKNRTLSEVFLKNC